MLRTTLQRSLLVVTLILLSSAAFAHDTWISQGGFKNPAGEWCCGEGDCFVVPGQNVSIQQEGYKLFGGKETIPFNQTLPSPDGAFWRCHRPDGSPRCFFAPPPEM